MPERPTQRKMVVRSSYPQEAWEEQQDGHRHCGTKGPAWPQSRLPKMRTGANLQRLMPPRRPIAHPRSGSRTSPHRRRQAREEPSVSPSRVGPTPPGNRPRNSRSPVDIILEQATSREPDLIPIRHGRMMVSPFTFYRGAAAIMAADLATTPVSGLRVQCCGDAHLLNFGGFASGRNGLSCSM